MQYLNIKKMIKLLLVFLGWVFLLIIWVRIRSRKAIYLTIENKNSYPIRLKKGYKLGKGKHRIRVRGINEKEKSNY